MLDKEQFKGIYYESRNGANEFYMHPVNHRFQYSDGVRDLAQLGMHWLLDIAATELPRVMRNHQEIMGILHVQVTDKSEALLRFDFKDEDAAVPSPAPWSRTIEYTDLPQGRWIFFIADDGQRVVMILPTEY